MSFYGKVVHKGHFDAAHCLEGFGKCSNLHGHTYTVEIEISGPVMENGVIADFRDVKDCYMCLDHKNLNEVLGVLPTAENTAIFILETLHAKFDLKPGTKHDREYRVRLWEGKNNYVEFEL